MALLELGQNDTKDGEYSATIKGLADSAQLDAALIFCAKDNVEGLGYWENDASYYALFVNDGKNLGLARMDNGWKGWLKEAAIPNYSHGDEVTVKAVVSADGKIDCYANGELLFTVEVGADALYGTGYGVRAKVAGVTFTNVVAKSNNIEYKGTWNKNGDKYVSLSESALIEIGKAETAVGTYKANITGDPNNTSLDAAIIFAAKDNVEGLGYWENDASYYAVMILNSGALGIARLNNGWGGWVDNKLPAIPNYKHGDTVEVKAEVFPDGTVKCYANGELLITVNVGAENLYGTGYGYRSRIAGATFDSFEYSPLYTTIQGEFAFNDDNTVTRNANNSLVIKGEQAPTAAGKYTLTYNNIADGDHGMVIAYSKTGDATWEGEGISYYFIFVSPDGVFIGKTDNGVWSTIENSGARCGTVYRPNYAEAGEHTVTVDYNGAGVFVVYLDGIYAYTKYDTAPLTGTGYGYRAGKPDVTFTSIEYAASENTSTYEFNNKMLVETTATGDKLYHPTGWWNSTVNQGDVTGYQAPQGTYEVTMTYASVGDNCNNFYFAGTGMTDNKIWSGEAYHVAMLDHDTLGLTKSSGDWGGWAKTADIANPNKEAVTIKAEYKIEGGVGTIKVYAKVGDADYTLAYEYTDNAPLQGKAYGVELAMFGSVSTPVKFTANKSPFVTPGDSEDAENA
ncbi:MAG: hypothetical protein IJF55_02010 [Clostridia bacterium]|nr:hypothetical protein [Clostridia bacterium]